MTDIESNEAGASLSLDDAIALVLAAEPRIDVRPGATDEDFDEFDAEAKMPLTPSMRAVLAKMDGAWGGMTNILGLRRVFYGLDDPWWTGKHPWLPIGDGHQGTFVQLVEQPGQPIGYVGMFGATAVRHLVASDLAHFLAFMAEDDRRWPFDEAYVRERDPGIVECIGGPMPWTVGPPPPPAHWPPIVESAACTPEDRRSIEAMAAVLRAEAEAHARHRGSDADEPTTAPSRLVNVPPPVGDGATNADLDAFEARYGIVLPESLRVLLGCMNGCSHGLLRGTDEMRSTLDGKWGHWTPPWLPIAHDECGDDYVLLLSDPSGPVGFIDQSDPEKVDYLVASSLERFLFLFHDSERALDEDRGTRWPFDETYMREHDPKLFESTAGPLPWEVDDEA